MAEVDLQTNIIKFLEFHEFVVIRVVVAQHSGVGDIVACDTNGRFWKIEVKDKGKEPTDLQLRNLDKVRKNKGIAFWCDTWESFVNCFKLCSMSI